MVPITSGVGCPCSSRSVGRDEKFVGLCALGRETDVRVFRKFPLIEASSAAILYNTMWPRALTVPAFDSRGQHAVYNLSVSFSDHVQRHCDWMLHRDDEGPLQPVV